MNIEAFSVIYIMYICACKRLIKNSETVKFARNMRTLKQHSIAY